MNQFVESEEEVLLPNKSKQKTAAPGGAQQNPTPAPAAVRPAPAESADDNFDPQTVSTALPKVTVNAGQVARIAILGPVVSGFRHFHEPSKTYVRCISERDPK